MCPVLLIGPLLPSGGVTRYVRDLLSWSGRYRFILFNVARPAKSGVKPGTGYSEMSNAGLLRLLFGVLVTLGHLIAFPWVLIRSKARIIHVCGVSYWPFWENAYYIFMSKLSGCHVTLHYLGALDLYYTSRGNIERALIRMVLRQPEKVILLSEKAYALASTFIPIERLSVIPSNVDVDRFKPNGNKPSTKDGIVRVLFVGGVDPFRKGVFDLLEAAASVVKINPKVRFIMSGGDSFREVEKRWRTLRLQEYIDFIGWIPEEKKVSVYQSVDILALPSHNEGLPYVVIEALASGLPIIATSVGGIPEVVIHGENGYIIEPGDSRSLAGYILALAGDSKLRLTMSERNRQRAMERYSTDAALGRLDGLFKQVLVE